MELFWLVHEKARNNACKAVLTAPDGYVVKIMPSTRSLAQNAKLWAMLSDVSTQVEWHGRHLTPHDWKHMFSSQILRLEVVPNLDNTGFVVLGQSTSQMSVSQMSEMIELIYAFGAEHNVKWSEASCLCY